MVFQNNVLSGAAGSGTTVYEIEQSIRFNDNDSAYMYRAFSGAGNKKTATMSCWVKLGSNLSNRRGIFSFIGDVPLEIFTGDTLRVFTFGTTSLVTNRVFRDPAGWYHFVVSIDSTQSVSTERIRLYVNGQRETSFSTESYPSLNADGTWWGSNFIQIGRTYGTSVYMDGYLAEIVYIDGTRLDPSSFGEYNSSGIWIPKDVSGLTFGTNGFYLKGADSSALGTDSSGNGSNFTTSGLASNDQMSDSPTTNWCVMNPLLNNGCTYTNGNLEVAPPNLQTTHRLVLPTMGILPSDTNKYYWEITYLASDNSSSVNMLGVAGLDRADNPASATLNGDGDGYGLGYNTSTSNIYAGGNWTANGSPTWSGGFTAGAIYGVAYDGSTKRLYFYENNSALNSGNHFATYTGSAPLGPGASLYYSPSSSKLIFNMGANGFTYTPPTGYVAVNTTNLGS
jgi:hypothetical protein